MSTPSAVLAFPQVRRLNRRRSWLALAVVSALVGIYVTWWVGYTTIHLSDRYRQLPAGESATVSATTVTVASLTTSQLLRPTGQDASGDAEAADAGAVWVVAELTLTRHDAARTYYCDFTLVTTEGRSWENNALPSVSRGLDSCATDAPVGQPQRIEEIFMVPEADAGRLAGIAMGDPTSPDRVAVLSPAR